MLYVINYADGEPFETYQKLNSRTAKWIGGADKVIEYSSKIIPQSYKEAHSEIFAYKRGAGLWLWKPYVILDALHCINNNDWLFYCDSACFFVRRIKPLINYAEKHKRPFMLFGLPLLNRQFCKKECYVKLGLEERGENQAVGTYMLIKKTPENLNIVKEWLLWCEREELISPDLKDKSIGEFPDFFSHREDQSLLSLISYKYNIPLNLECSNFRIFPYQYCYKEFEYSPLPIKKCSYGLILINHRATKPSIYLKIFLKIWILKTLGIRYTEKQRLANKPSFFTNFQR